ncbi:guanosine monophosphate reductase [Weissella confusa]|uniref:Guanosine monophosphate reductase n=1 Tax=Weissella confusa TaxID=1583 RepID=A0AAJ2Z0T1_WEICO|nr:IMP dehydrogenase [Weissella confusa]MBJ7693922.1 IMP dehydrogenase [Weissella confusa]NBA12473.1 guanosine monophosphate reductase [Weissella confusa]QBZ04486.1 guanosine monophosphate reductase [Weissella confusa]
MSHFSATNKFVPMGLTFDDVQLVNNATNGLSQSDISLATTLTPTLHLNIPMLSAAMDTVTEARLATQLALLGGMGVVHKNMLIADQAAEVAKVKAAEIDAARYPQAAVDYNGRLLVAGAVGVTSDTVTRVGALVEAGVDAIVLDSAHGHSEGVLRKVSEVRAAFPELNIIAGNIATKAGAAALYDAGADVVKVGIGPGSICTTRVVAGVGVPQISAIADAAEVAKRYGKTIIADGGIKDAGDVVKALASGGNAVMLGSMLAGTLEAPGEVFTDEQTGHQYKSYRGMGSIAAMENGSKDRYFQGEVNEANKMVPEGIEARTAYKGALTDVLNNVLVGVRRGMVNAGATTIDEMVNQGHLANMKEAVDYTHLPQVPRIVVAQA